jgi:hypothetical protein
MPQQIRLAERDENLLSSRRRATDLFRKICRNRLDFLPAFRLVLQSV